VELPADAKLGHGAEHIAARNGPARLAQKLRHIDAKSGIDDPIGEADDFRRDAGNFMHDDDGGAHPPRIDGFGYALMGELGLLIVGQHAPLSPM
jgi:hypothetical protein